MTGGIKAECTQEPLALAGAAGACSWGLPRSSHCDGTRRWAAGRRLVTCWEPVGSMLAEAALEFRPSTPIHLLRQPLRILPLLCSPCSLHPRPYLLLYLAECGVCQPRPGPAAGSAVGSAFHSPELWQNVAGYPASHRSLFG